jgi:O-methyltransferase
MKAQVKAVLIRLGLYGLDRRLKKACRIAKYEMSFPPYGKRTQAMIRASIDVVRHGAVALAINRLERNQVPGAFAEVGVYKGELSKFIATLAPHRTLHLFDTFAGFPAQDAAAPGAPDERFQDTSVEAVRRHIGADASRVVFHPGYFPETAAAIAAETFAFVMVDVDKYKPTLAALEVFYPRMSPGGYIFIHDYNSPESDYGVSRAADQFFADKPERLIEIPDRGGSVVVRKVENSP